MQVQSLPVSGGVQCLTRQLVGSPWRTLRCVQCWGFRRLGGGGGGGGGGAARDNSSSRHADYVM